jgi:Suppressor of fused protein (SUFU)
MMHAVPVADLIAHLECYLGEMLGGTQGSGSTPDRIQVATFGPNSPFAGATTLVTLGLSAHHLVQPSGKGVHQELLMHFRTGNRPGNAVGLLFQVAAELITRGTGLLRGEVLGPRGQLFSRGDTTALYAAAPVFLPDDFAICREPNRTIVLVWLMPITTLEADFVRERGWPAFEDLLVAADPDLTDMSRPSVVSA